MAAMLDVEQHPPPASNTINFEELFNMELFGPSTSTTSPNHSRTSSNSPDATFLSLPATSSADIALDPALYNFDFANSFLKPIDLSASPSDSITSPASSAPFDFFGSFSGSGSGSNSSPDTSPGSVTFSPKSVIAIDPSLVGAPSPVTLPPQPQLPPPDADADVENSEDSDDDNEELLRPAKVGGRGKSSRKGTVVTGGVAKRTSAIKDKSANDDDWRPSPEEYKKMSSKEKRQLRNKISARNFRVRRKEYISTLEGDIAERDRLIDAIRDELGSTKLENVALRQEVDALKRAMLEGRSAPALPPPAPLPTTTPAPAAATTKRPTRTSLATPNTQKDLAASPRTSSARAFWGGSLGAGGVTPVHATLVPEFPQNINPALNLPCFGGIGANPKLPLSPFHTPGLGANFDAFAEMNPFTLKTLDAYRMQLWGRMAREVGAAQAQAQAQAQRPPSPPTSVHTSNLRPSYFTTPISTATPLKDRDINRYTPSTFAALLTGKSAAASLYPTPPPTPPRGPEIQPAHAVLAGLAGQTLLSKMGSAFWDAFAGRGKPDLDQDKVRRVLEGRAVVRVVDVEADALEERMRGLAIGSAAAPQPQPQPQPQQNPAPAASHSCLLSRTCAAVVGKKQ